jgi:hypothetical protein
VAHNGLAWTKVEMPFAAGLSQKSDDRARPQPFLDICRDVQFDEDGGLQTRLPFAAMSNSIFGGGTLSNCRRLAVVNDELCVFTDTALYSWNAQLANWVLRGTHLAVSVDETPRGVTTDDQVDGDRAELAGTILVVWSVNNTTVYVEALDKSTGSVLMSPTAIAGTFIRPRLVALATKILLFVHDNASNLKVFAIDPTSPATAIAGAATAVLASNANFFYDVVRAGTQDLVVGAIRRTTTTSYTVFTVTSSLGVTTSTKARTADGPLAVATVADGTQTQVIRGNGTNVQGDLVTTSTLADVFTAQAIGTVSATPINQITAAFSSTTCTAFWSHQESSSAAAGIFATKKNTVTTSNVVGTQSNLILELGVASQAFTCNGSAFVWLAFAGDSTTFGSGSPLGVRAQLQNTYFLLRADGLVVSKATWGLAGGFSPSTGHLPGVQSTSGSAFAWLGTRRRRIDLGNDVGHTGLAARSPVEIAFSFDAAAARRVARLGRTLYIGGGILNQYDGLQLVEVGFLVYPWAFASSDIGIGNLSAGSYSWKSTLAWTNAQGEHERSTTATGELLTLTAGREVLLTVGHLYATNKLSRPPSIEIWRTVASAGVDAPYYLTTSQDPTTGGADNGYIANNITFSFTSQIDNMSDASVATKEANPENGDTLESLAPPGAKIIIATDTRLFIASIAGDPDRVWYSRLRDDGEIASFHDELTIDIPRPGGDITSIAFLDETLFVFRQTATYALPGIGLDNNGEGQGFGPARIVSLDVGAVNHESVALTPLGLIFKSRKGWQLLHGNGAVEYIGDKASDFDTETPLAVTVVETQHQVRILTASRLIVWDYRVNQWGEWTISDGIDACMYGGAQVYLTATGPKVQQTTYSGLTYGMDVETAWIKLSGLQGATRCRKLQPLGEYRSSHSLRLRVAYNYQVSGGAPAYVDDRNWAPSPTTVGGPLQVAYGPKRPICESIKLRITAENADGLHGAPTGEALKLTSLGLEVGTEPGLLFRLPPAQRV